jgi:hypothetical protein
MIYVVAVVCGLLLGAALGFGSGFAAASVYTGIGGARDGGPAMAGFFYVGPFGLLAGFLLGAALVLHFGATPGALSKGLFWGGGVLSAIGLVVFLLPVLMNQSERAARSKINLEMQFEVKAAEAERLNQLKWGYQGEALEGKAEYPFYNSRQEGEVYYLQGDMQMTDNPSHRVGLFARQGKVQTFSIPKEGPVQELSDWSEWQQGEAVKFRWRMAAAR